ncbi:cytochrome P450 [Penicillium manginii]|uniref:cytochrome P450 n=1 Tax=Penicillium manginii TaxID=203109 RepID=UPI002548EDDD|nr:cytochrome P450 [Penicillium manginii]KAJ5732920.1 cytochrome P450 [Penicillium manginii]
MLLEFFSNGFVWTFVVIIAALYHFLKKDRPIFPIVNNYPGDYFRQKAYSAYDKNAKKLIVEGLVENRGPIAILAPGGMKIVLPSALSDWVKTNRDLDHQELVREQFFAHFPGFEAQYTLHCSDRILINLLRTKLSQNEEIMPIINQHIGPALQYYWSDSKAWHFLDWENDTTGIISRAAASIFVGPEKATDPEWQNIVQSYVREFFAAAGELSGWKVPLRPIVQWVLPHASACRDLRRQACNVMENVVQRRIQEAKAAEAQGAAVPQYNDVVDWTMQISENNHSAGDIQLALAMAALFTTSEIFRQILIDIARHSELLEPLRQEIKKALADHDLGLAALAKMELLDSVMKESQRQIPISG